MTRISSLATTALSLLCSTACGPQAGRNPPPRPLTAQEHALVETSNSFGWRLFAGVVSQSADQDVFVSPLSVSMALGMTYNGASGDTLTAMAETLGLLDLTLEEANEAFRSLTTLLLHMDSKVQFNLANSIWYRDDFSVQAEFIDTNQTYFDAVVSALDFASDSAADAMNAWVNDKTHGLIDAIVEPPIDPLTMMFLINTIYFKGDWTTQFAKEQTASETFHSPAQDISVDMMHLGGAELPYTENDRLQAVDLPYGDGYFRMMVLLPRPGVEPDQIVSELNEATWAELAESVVLRPGNLALPKFTLEYDERLNDVLEALGMEVAFDDLRAEFARIDPDIPLYISEVKHKSFVKLDEEGTEAAATTSVEIRTRSASGSAGFDMRVDRPFVIALHDVHSQTVLFAGKVLRPQSQ